MNHSRIVELLEKAKLPVKDSYVRILVLFAASPKKSFTATEVYQQLIAADPEINVTSTYRIVRSLHKASLLECEKGAAGYGGGKNIFRFAASTPAAKKIRITGNN
jgi:Fe2+ or Zn2+ uptake regulation protein